MEEIHFGQFTLSTIVAVLMGVVLNAFPSFPDRFKHLLAMIFGATLGLLGIVTSELPWTPAVVTMYLISGIMYGVQAVGTYHVLKKEPRT